MSQFITYTAADGAPHIERVSEALAQTLVEAGIAHPLGTLTPQESADAIHTLRAQS